MFVCVCVCVCVCWGVYTGSGKTTSNHPSPSHTHTQNNAQSFISKVPPPPSDSIVSAVSSPHLLSSSPLFISSPRLLSSSPLPSLYCPSLIFRCTALLSHVFAVSCLVEAEDVLFLRSVFTGRKHDISLPNSRENLRAQKHIRVETDESFSDIQQICVCRPTVIPLCPLLLIPAP